MLKPHPFERGVGVHTMTPHWLSWRGPNLARLGAYSLNITLEQVNFGLTWILQVVGIIHLLFARLI